MGAIRQSSVRSAGVCGSRLVRPAIESHLSGWTAGGSIIWPTPYHPLRDRHVSAGTGHWPHPGTAVRPGDGGTARPTDSTRRQEQEPRAGPDRDLSDGAPPHHSGGQMTIRRAGRQRCQTAYNETRHTLQRTVPTQFTRTRSGRWRRLSLGIQRDRCICRRRRLVSAFHHRHRRCHQPFLQGIIESVH